MSNGTDQSTGGLSDVVTNLQGIVRNITGVLQSVNSIDIGVLGGTGFFLRSSVPATTVNGDTFITSGYTTVGDRGAGAIYTSVNATTGGPLAIQDGSGTWFNLVSFGNQPIS